ncbi:MAG: hypothetical protein ACKOY8_10510, partial [Verrucomicrobiota bacterium]
MRTFPAFLLSLLAAVCAAQSPTNGRKVVWEDQFNAAEVDGSKWAISTPQHVSIKGGKLVLGFHMTPEGPRGGGVSTAGKFEQ